MFAVNEKAKHVKKAPVKKDASGLSILTTPHAKLRVGGPDDNLAGAGGASSAASSKVMANRRKRNKGRS